MMEDCTETAQQHATLLSYKLNLSEHSFMLTWIQKEIQRGLDIMPAAWNWSVAVHLLVHYVKSNEHSTRQC